MTRTLKANWPHELYLLNPITSQSFPMYLVGDVKMESTIDLDPPDQEGKTPEKVILDQGGYAQVCDAIAFLGLNVSLEAPKNAEYRARFIKKAKVSLIVDGEKVFTKLPLEELPGRNFSDVEHACLFRAQGARKEPVGLFVPHGTRVKVFLSSIPEESKVHLRVRTVLKTATYSTQRINPISDGKKTPDRTSGNRIPKWTVCYNVVSRESDAWVGTGWEFFDEEKDVQTCYDRHVEIGNSPTKRPFYRKVDLEHLGAAHRFWLEKEGA